MRSPKTQAEHQKKGSQNPYSTSRGSAFAEQEQQSTVPQSDSEPKNRARQTIIDAYSAGGVCQIKSLSPPSVRKENPKSLISIFSKQSTPR